MLKVTVRGHMMFSVSVRQFRIVCVLALAAHILNLVPSLGLVTFTNEVRTLRKWAHFDAVLTGWTLWGYSFVSWALILVGLIGMLNFWRSARWCLVIALAGSVLMRPFLGLSVYSAYEAALGTILGVGCAWLVTVSFWSPFANHFTHD